MTGHGGVKPGSEVHTQARYVHLKPLIECWSIVADTVAVLPSNIVHSVVIHIEVHEEVIGCQSRFETLAC